MEKRIYTIDFRLETNSFAGSLTTIEDYKKSTYCIGSEGIEKERGTNTSIGGFLDFFEGREDVMLLFGPRFSATPGGELREADFDFLCGEIVSAFEKYQKEAPVDGMLLSFHGAMMSEKFEDAEGEVLRRLKKVSGDLPTVIALDFHTNLTQDMVRLCDGIFVSRYYPHLDFNERGQEAAAFLDRMLKGEIHPSSVLMKLPKIFPIKSTYEEPLASLIREMKEARNEELLEVTFSAGFYLSDTKYNRSAIYAISENGPELAEKTAKKYYDIFMSHPEIFEIELPEVSEAVREAMRFPGMTVLAEASDNTGSGTGGDDTVLLKEMLSAGVTNAGFAFLVDPSAVRKCMEAGEGEEVQLTIGGHSATCAGEPLPVKAKVLKITDGLLTVKGPMYRGMLVKLGPSCAIQIEGITVILATHRRQPLDEEAFRIFGIEPTKFHIIALKSAIHYQAAYREIADRIVTLQVGDRTPLTGDQVKYTK